MTLQISDALQTSIAAPSQWTLRTTEGHLLNVRYRHGRGRVEVVDIGSRPHRDEAMAIVAAIEAQITTGWTDGDTNDSYRTLDQLLTKAGLELAPNAIIKPYDTDEDRTMASTDLTTTDPSPAPASAPAPLLRGKVALYELPTGGLMLVLRMDGATKDRQIVVEPYIVAGAASMAGITPAKALAQLHEWIDAE